MAEDAHPGFEPSITDDEDLAAAGPRPRLGVILAGLLAVLASAAMAWWVVAPERSRQIAAGPPVAAAPVKTAPPAAPLRYAAADPDPEQVRRAWRDVRRTYGDGGPEALVRGSQACAQGVPADPRSLDYCLAYDIYASAVATDRGQADWFGDAGDRGLALARTALPEGLDAPNRIAQVAALTQAVLPKVRPAKAKPPVVQAVWRHVRAKPHLVKAKHAHRLGHPTPKLLKASLHRRPHAPKRAAPSADQREMVRDADSQGPDSFLNRAQTGEFYDPPH
ncbi:MAG: hypothetical protein JWP50_181 [Phenylobacterium sp.]|nr:hypothetical protein [Phenylobacterium sp.]